jgi:hypothetical protein
VLEVELPRAAAPAPARRAAPAPRQIPAAAPPRRARYDDDDDYDDEPRRGRRRFRKRRTIDFMPLGILALAITVIGLGYWVVKEYGFKLDLSSTSSGYKALPADSPLLVAINFEKLARIPEAANAMRSMPLPEKNLSIDDLRSIAIGGDMRNMTALVQFKNSEAVTKLKDKRKFIEDYRGTALYQGGSEEMAVLDGRTVLMVQGRSVIKAAVDRAKDGTGADLPAGKLLTARIKNAPGANVPPPMAEFASQLASASVTVDVESPGSANETTVLDVEVEGKDEAAITSFKNQIEQFRATIAQLAEAAKSKPGYSANDPEVLAARKLMEAAVTQSGTRLSVSLRLAKSDEAALRGLGNYRNLAGPLLGGGRSGGFPQGTPNSGGGNPPPSAGSEQTAQGEGAGRGRPARPEGGNPGFPPGFGQGFNPPGAGGPTSIPKNREELEKEAEKVFNEYLADFPRGKVAIVIFACGNDEHKNQAEKLVNDAIKGKWSEGESSKSWGFGIDGVSAAVFAPVNGLESIADALEGKFTYTIDVEKRKLTVGPKM